MVPVPTAVVIESLLSRADDDAAGAIFVPGEPPDAERRYQSSGKITQADVRHS